MTTDFRALCAELADSVELLLEMRPLDAKPMAITEDRLIRARAALAAPEQGPTLDDAELRIAYAIGAKTRWREGFPEAWGLTDMERAAHIAGLHSVLAAVLARWGRPVVEPVPVSERLPRPEDCDDQGRCWWLARLPFPFTHWVPHWALPVPQEGTDG